MYHHYNTPEEKTGDTPEYPETKNPAATGLSF
jgi:hypothetical protein